MGQWWTLGPPAPNWYQLMGPQIRRGARDHPPLTPKRSLGSLDSPLGFIQSLESRVALFIYTNTVCEHQTIVALCPQFSGLDFEEKLNVKNSISMRRVFLGSIVSSGTKLLLCLHQFPFLNNFILFPSLLNYWK